MFQGLRNVMRPSGYHGQSWRPPFFEGWYFKVTDASARRAYAIIPGIYHATDPALSHAFVQLLDGQTGATAWQSYAYADFRCPAGELDIALAGNRFTATGLTVDVDQPGFSVRGSLSFDEIHPWPVTLVSPGIMGWYAWAPLMECYHGIVSLDHGVSGRLTINGEEIDFTGGRGYTEKDWGRSFPAAWVWMQTNRFDALETCLTASVAIIPWIGRAFPGFIAGLWHGGRLYRFATYTGARLESLELTDGAVRWILRDRDYRLSLSADRPGGGLLRAPSALQMDRRVAESLNARVEVRLTTLDTGAEVFAGTGLRAGLEVGGEMDRLLEMARQVGSG